MGIISSPVSISVTEDVGGTVVFDHSGAVFASQEGIGEVPSWVDEEGSGNTNESEVTLSVDDSEVSAGDAGSTITGSEIGSDV